MKIWATQAITDTLVLPTTLPPGASPPLYAMACRGQRVALSFCIRADVDCVVTLDVDNKYIPSIDLKWVVAWWQSPVRMGGKVPVMLPELLLNDPTLITPNADKTNTVRNPILDADEIEPLELKANTTQQVWVTVDVPTYCQTSRYRRNITMTANGKDREVPVIIDVLPFELAKSPLNHCVSFRGRLFGRKDHESKTEEQFEQELADIARHGVNRVIFYDDFNDMYRTPEHLEKLETWRRMVGQAGFPIDTLHAIFTPMNRYTDLAQIEMETVRFKQVLQNFGITTLYAHSRDEPSPEQMAAGLPFMQAARDGGAKVMTALIASSDDALEILGRHMDLPMFSGSCIGSEDIAKWHAVGSKVWYYHCAYWPSGETHYRRRFGLDAMAEGFDGCSLYAYQHQMGPSIWNDMDHFYPDHVCAYPTHGGPVGSLQWPGYAAGIDDTRIAQTLIEHGGALPEHDGRNLDEVRREMIFSILNS